MIRFLALAVLFAAAPLARAADDDGPFAKGAWALDLTGSYTTPIRFSRFSAHSRRGPRSQSPSFCWSFVVPSAGSWWLPSRAGRPFPSRQWSRSRPRRRAAYIRANLAFTIR